MTDEPLIYTKRDDGVAIVAINDHPLNRMTLAYVNRLEAVIDDIANDDAIRAFVITAEGTTNFSVGMNLKELGPGMAAAGVDAFFDQRVNLIGRIEAMGKPPRARRSASPRWTSVPRRPGVVRLGSRNASVASMPPT